LQTFIIPSLKRVIARNGAAGAMTWQSHMVYVTFRLQVT